MGYMSELTALFASAGAGDGAAFDRVFALLYDDLVVIARARLRGGQRVTLADTGALVHESWLRLQAAGRLEFQDRHHFLAHAARVMRSVIVDLVRRSRAERRGGKAEFLSLDTAAHDGLPMPGPEPELLQVAEAIEELERLDPRLARVVEMRYFAGLTEPDIATALGVTDRTVRRDWEKAKAFLAVVLKR